MFILIVKGERGVQLTENFKSSEFLCKCSYNDCNHSFVNEDTLESLQGLRTALGVALRITSAHRCQRHNADVGGLPTSQHLRGSAVDLEVPVGLSIKEFSASALASGFDVVIEYKEDNFIHCHRL